MREGRVRRGYLGIGGQNVPILRRVARFHKIEPESGILVIHVEPGSPAAMSGVQLGDVIVNFDSVPIGSLDALQKTLTTNAIGKTTELRVLRNTDLRVVSITPAEQFPANNAPVRP
jgi:S1-C subfamily serine protease